MSTEKISFHGQSPEVEIPNEQLEIIPTPDKENAPDVRSIIDLNVFDKTYPPLPSEQERDRRHPGEPLLN